VESGLQWARRLPEDKVESNRITFTAKSADRGIAESLADFAAGRSFGPFKTQKELISSLRRERSKILSKTQVKRKQRG
jgi:hypothetical protein